MKIIKMTVFALILGLATPTSAPALDPAQIGRTIHRWSHIPRFFITGLAFSAHTERSRAWWEAAGALFDASQCTPSKEEVFRSRDSMAGIIALLARSTSNAENVLKPLLSLGKKNKNVPPIKGLKYVAASCALLVEILADEMTRPGSPVWTLAAKGCCGVHGATNGKEHELLHIVRVTARALRENLVAGGDLTSLPALLANSATIVQLIAHSGRYCSTNVSWSDKWDAHMRIKNALHGQEPHTQFETTYNGTETTKSSRGPGLTPNCGISISHAKSNLFESPQGKTLQEKHDKAVFESLKELRPDENPSKPISLSKVFWEEKSHPLYGVNTISTAPQGCEATTTSLAIETTVRK